jgi:hypothetical protein
MVTITSPINLVLRHLTKGSQVAIMPAAGAPAEMVIEMAQVYFGGNGFFQLVNGRVYSSQDGRCLSSPQGGYAVVAMPEHHAALIARS